jgi:hypothetical protein
MRRYTYAPLAVAVCLVVAASPAAAQSQQTEHTLALGETGARPRATIDRLAWLVGHWEGEAFGGTFEESWSPPSVGTMVGSFKLKHDGKPTMYELFLLVEEEGTLTIKLKHFDPDLKGWEEKDDFVSFPLVKITDDAAHFDGLTYVRRSTDEIAVFLAIRKDGTLSEETLIYRRAKNRGDT